MIPAPAMWHKASFVSDYSLACTAITIVLVRGRLSCGTGGSDGLPLGFEQDEHIGSRSGFEDFQGRPAFKFGPVEALSGHADHGTARIPHIATDRISKHGEGSSIGTRE